MMATFVFTVLDCQTLESRRFDVRDDPGRHGRRCTNPQPTRESGLMKADRTGEERAEGKGAEGNVDTSQACFSPTPGKTANHTQPRGL